MPSSTKITDTAYFPVFWIYERHSDVEVTKIHYHKPTLTMPCHVSFYLRSELSSRPSLESTRIYVTNKTWASTGSQVASWTTFARAFQYHSHLSCPGCGGTDKREGDTGYTGPHGASSSCPQHGNVSPAQTHIHTHTHSHAHTKHTTNTRL